MPHSSDDASKRLTAPAIFRAACLAATRDGHIDEGERAVLKKLQKLLRIPPDEAKATLRDASQAASREDGRLDPEALFASTCELAWADGELEPEELQLLTTLAGVLGLKAARARAILDDVCRPSSPAPESAPEPSPIPTLTSESEAASSPTATPRPTPAVAATPAPARLRAVAQPSPAASHSGALRLLALGAMLVGFSLGASYLYNSVLFPPPPPGPGPARQFTAAEVAALTPQGFLALSEGDRRSALVAMILAMNSPDASAAPLLRFVAATGEAGGRREMVDTCLQLLERRDRRLVTQTWDTRTIIEPGGKVTKKRVNVRSDSTWADEQLLYLIRDNPDDADRVTGELYRIIDGIRHPMSRMRLVRAIGKIGGERAPGYIKAIRSTEENPSSYASQEASRWLSGQGRAGSPGQGLSHTFRGVPSR